jgi:predicted exporter
MLYHGIAIALVTAVIAYIILIIKPFPARPQD